MENKQKTGRLITLTAVKTIIAFVIILFFVCLGVYVINPRFSARVVGKVGWTSAEVNCLELVYARSKSTADLYNLIVKMDNSKNYSKQNEYIAKLIASEDYDEFCTSMNNSIASGYRSGKLDAKTLSSIYGINEYITSKRIINLIKLDNLEGAYKVAIESINTDTSYEISVYYYADYLMSTEVSIENRTKYLRQLFDNKDIINNLDFRYKTLNQSQNTDKAAEILNTYAKLKIKYTEYLIYKNANNAEATVAFNDWQTLQATYNNLVKGNN